MNELFEQLPPAHSTLHTPHLQVGCHVLVNNRHKGLVSEIVPANQLPRTVRHNAEWRRPVESYVVTILTSCTVRLRASSALGRAGGRASSLSCRRIWPSPQSIRLQAGGLS